jgi:hypothetical protein
MVSDCSNTSYKINYLVKESRLKGSAHIQESDLVDVACTCMLLNPLDVIVESLITNL